MENNVVGVQKSACGDMAQPYLRQTTKRGPAICPMHGVHGALAPRHCNSCTKFRVWGMPGEILGNGVCAPAFKASCSEVSK